MPRSQPTDPAFLDRLRQLRAAEDAALADVTNAQARLAAATVRRAKVLADLDAAVENAELEVAHARAGLVEAAGPDRAALTLGMSRTALRRSLPHGRDHSRPDAPQSTDLNGTTDSSTSGGA